MSSDGPIESSRTDDDAQERMDRFVVGLGERIDSIQEADRQGELEAAGGLATDLAAEASELGLPELVVAAERVAASCKRGDTPATHDEIVELTDVIRRVRLGHRTGY